MQSSTGCMPRCCFAVKRGGRLGGFLEGNYNCRSDDHSMIAFVLDCDELASVSYRRMI